MQMKERFFSLHRQGFVRVAACTPRIEVGDPKSNAEETLALMREGHARSADLMLFPELGVSAYAIDDLLLQTRCSMASSKALHGSSKRRSRCARYSSSAHGCAATGGSTTAQS
jgi:predicted amidohydrolase